MPGRGIVKLANATDVYSSDYNGYRPNRDVKLQYTFLGPKPGQSRYEPSAEDWQSFTTLDEFRRQTGQEQHSREVDFDIFEKLAPPNPVNEFAVYHAMDLNFQLKESGAAVDAGVVIPTVNEEHTGRAPDLGALEIGKSQPHYGPRWITWQPFYR